MPKIDIGAVLAAKAPRLKRFVPGFALRWLRRTVHEREVNEIIENYWGLPPREFIRSFFAYMRIDYAAEGLERLDPAGRYLFASNHPFGGMDGLMLASLMIDRFGDARVVVNDLLTHVEPLRELWVPVNKHGSQSAHYARISDEAYSSPVPLLTFPAGLCSRRVRGAVSDLEWKSGFVKRARSSGRRIVPVFVEGELSDFFYRLSRIRTALRIPFNVEMLWLPDEMFAQRGRSFRIRFGEPIPWEVLDACPTLRAKADCVRAKVYSLRKSGDRGAGSR